MKNQIQGSLGTTHQGRNDMKFSFKLASALAILMLAVPVTALAQPKKIVLGFSQIGAESEWRTANTESIKQAAKDAGIELKFSDAQQKQENQIKAIRSFIAQRVDVIAFSPVVESGWETVLKEAKSAGIPVILSDRAVDVKDDSLWVSFMGSDFVEEGRRAANWLVEYLDKKGVKGDVNIVELQGTVGSAPAIDRKKGFEEVLKSHPNLKVTRSQTGDFTRAKGKEVMEAFLKADKKINVNRRNPGHRRSRPQARQGHHDRLHRCRQGRL
jgi:ABC-type sugar transport system substrate-binding protein